MPAPVPSARAARRLSIGIRRLMPAFLCRWADAHARDQLTAAMAELQPCQEALQRFGRKSDMDFTALAQGLSHLNQRLANLRTQAEQLELILDDRDDDRALSSARTLYRSSVDLVHASMGTALSEQEQMKSIEESLLRACRARAKFKRNHLLLRILTMSVRMEASRMNPEFQGVFLNVAAAIGEISDKIARSTETAFDRIEAVIAEARTERGNLKDLEKNLLTRAESSIQRIDRDLDALKGSLQPCVDQSRGIAGLFAAVTPATVQTLASLQHQDIVRQQLEHVVAGFDDIRRRLLDDPPASQPEARLELGYVHSAAGVQQAQLRAARAEIEKAAAEVTSGLQSLQEIGGKLAVRFATMESAGCAAFRDCRVAPMFRDEIHRLAQVADMSEKANDKISGLVDRIAEVVRFFSGEISRCELDVKIVALNAQIAAARLPSADALNKLAEETSILSGENAHVTGDLVAELQTGLDALLAIKRDADEFLGIVTSEKAELERGMVTVSEKLVRLGESVQSRSAQVRREFEAANGETRALIDGLGFPALVASCYAPAERLCESFLTATVDYANPEESSGDTPARFDSNWDRDTLHRGSATRASAFSRGVEATAAPATIELFTASESPPATAAPAPGNATSSQPFQTEPVDAPKDGPTPASPCQPASPAPAPEAPESSEFGDGIQLF